MKLGKVSGTITLVLCEARLHVAKELENCYIYTDVQIVDYSLATHVDSCAHSGPGVPFPCRFPTLLQMRTCTVEIY